MKYFRKILFLVLTFSFSAKMNMVFAFDNSSIKNESLSIMANTTKQEDNKNLINMPKEQVVEVFNSNDNKVYLTENDIYLMAQIVYAESKGEPYEGKVAVASVILNRVLSPGFPGTIRDVIFQPNAFSCVVNGKLNVSPSTECYNAVYDAIKGKDPTNKALFFYNPTIATCSWMQGVEKKDSKSIGQHLFFKITYK